MRSSGPWRAAQLRPAQAYTPPVMSAWLAAGFISSTAERARDGVAPARPFALAGGGVHLRLEAPLALPRCGEARQIRAQSCSTSREIGGTDRGRLHHCRAVDRRVENVGQELHGDVARRHAT